MKKTALLFVAAMALSAAGFAQGVSFGVKAGVNFANQNFEVEGFSMSPDARTGFHVGGFVTAMFSEQFGLQPELLFNSVGSSFDFSGESVKQNFNYISVPVLFRYQPVAILNIHAGPQVGFLMSAKAKVDGETEDIEDTKSLDFGAAIGAGVDLPMGLGFAARYVAGLANVYDVDEITVKNNVFQISVSYRFGGSN